MTMVKYIVNHITEICSEIEMIDIKKSYLLHTLKKVTTYYGYMLNENQNLVLNTIISKTNKNIIIDFYNPKIMSMINNLVTKDLNIQIIFGKLMYKIDSNISYICSFINLLTACGMNKNTFAENIGQVLLPASKAIELIMIQTDDVYFKHCIINFFYIIH